MARGLLILLLLLGGASAKANGPDGGGAAWCIGPLHPVGLVRLLPVGGGPAVLVPTATLPPGAREGDVLVDGRLDPALRARLLRAQRRLRAGAARGSFSLDAEEVGTRPLTAEGER